jgi:hypothetical protein
MPQRRAAWLSRRRIVAPLAIACVLSLPLSGMLLSEAWAQGLFGALFGAITGQRPPPARQAPSLGYSDPSAEPRAPETRSASSGRGGNAHCVRLCDGRHFPVARSANVAPGALCSALCPASKTKVFYGSAIDTASAEDGGRYSDLPTAFAYRQRVSSDCTCNGRDILGLARMDVASDPTLRAGDMIATAQGVQVFTGSAQARNRSLPMQLHSASSDSRRRLTTTGAAPAD